MDRINLEDFKSSIDIIDLVSRRVSLNRNGEGLCPFHKEKTPSFKVYAETGTWKCYGCGERGDVITFVQQAENIENFIDAVNWLAETFNLSSPAVSSRHSRETQVQRRGLRSLLDEVCSLYETQLTVNPQARSYLLERGVSEESIRKWRIGFAPDDWDFLVGTFPDEDLERAGLRKWTDAQGGKYFDFFRNRILFPICDAQGNIISFGGRTLDEHEKAKYLNTSETALYKKRSVLFGLNNAIEAQRETKRRAVMVVEGYMDAIMTHQFGIRNVVALCGTALTPQHAKVLKRYFDVAFVTLDPDSPGETRTPDAAKELMHHDMKVKVVQLPPGKDVDELLLAEGADVVKDRIRESVSLYDFVLGNAVRDCDMDDPEQKWKVLRDLIPFLAYTGGFTKRRVFLHETAKRLGLDYANALAALKDYERGRAQPTVSGASEQEEFDTLLMMIKKADFLPYLAQRLTPEHFENPTYRAMFEFLRDNYGEREALVDELLMSVDPLDLFEERPIPTDGVLDYCAAKGIDIERDDLEGFFARLRSASARDLDEEWVRYGIEKSKRERDLLELEERIDSSDNGVAKLLRKYERTYNKPIDLS